MASEGGYLYGRGGAAAGLSVAASACCHIWHPAASVTAGVGRGCLWQWPLLRERRRRAREAAPHAHEQPRQQTLTLSAPATHRGRGPCAERMTCMWRWRDGDAGSLLFECERASCVVLVEMWEFTECLCLAETPNQSSGAVKEFHPRQNRPAPLSTVRGLNEIVHIFRRCGFTKALLCKAAMYPLQRSELLVCIQCG
jgi:hypothetical protein